MNLLFALLYYEINIEGNPGKGVNFKIINDGEILINNLMKDLFSEY